jgi:hypothetical protein
MEKIIKQLSDEQLMALLAYVENHQISQAIHYLRTAKKLDLDQAKTLVMYCVEKRQHALYGYQLNYNDVSQIQRQETVKLNEKYQFDDVFIRDLQFPITSNKTSPQSFYQLHFAAKPNSKSILILLLMMTIVLSLILLVSIDQ